MVPATVSGSAASAQQPRVSATLSGRVTDPTGALIVNAGVRISGTASNGAVDQTLETDRGGRFSLSVAPGTYTVHVESEGFEPFTSAPLRMRERGTMQLPVQLVVAGRNEEIEVGTQRGSSTDPDDNASAAIFSGEKLNMLSDDPATLQQQINALAGPGLGGNTQILVNGFSGGRIPPKAAIRSITINGNPYSAYYDSPGFGRVEIDTKPGGDKLHGSLDFSGTDQPLDTRNPFTLSEPPFYQFQTDGNLTGPIGKKTAFFAAGNLQQLGNNAVLNAVILDPALANSAYSATVPAPQLSQTYSLRLDRQFNPNHFGFIRNEWSNTHTTNDGLLPLLLPSAAYVSNMLTNTLQATDTQLLGPHAVNEARFQDLRTRLSQTPASTATTLLVQGAFQKFGNPAQFARDNQDHYELQDRFEFDRGKHAVRTGVRFRAVREANASTANFNGEYIFNNLAAYQITQQGLAAGLTPAQIRANGGGASQFSLTTGQPSATVSTDDLGLYAEADWHLRRDVTLSYGFRFESQSAIPDHADPAPRLGIAWSVHRGKRPMPVITLRAGYGIFYSRFPAGSLLQAVRQNGVSETAFFAQNPDTFAQNPDGAPIAPPPNLLPASQPTIYRVSPTLRNSMAQIGSLGVDRIIGRRGTVSANVLYGHGAHASLLRNINAPLPGTYDPAVLNSGVRPLGTTQNIYQYSSDSNENDELFFTTVQLNLTKSLYLYTTYILQKQYDDGAGPNSFASDSYNVRADYGRQSGQQSQILNSALFWQLPRAFTAALFFNAHDGNPFNITTGTDRNGDTIYNDRPAFATDLARPSVVRTAFGAFDTAPMSGQAIIPRNYGTSPSLFWVDLQLRKSFHVGPLPQARAVASAPGSKSAAGPRKPERPWELRFQIDAQNLLNHTNPGLPIGVLPTPGQQLCAGLVSANGCSFFGRSLSSAADFNPLTSSNRTILLQAAFTF